MPNAKGQTRRERNEAFGQGHLSPDIEVPEDVLYLWEMFWQMIENEGRVIQGEAFPVSAGSLKAWAEINEHDLTQWEYATLADLSAEWARAINKELAERRAQEIEDAKKK